MVATWLNLNWSIEINFILKRPFLLVQVLLLKHCCYMLWSFHHSVTPVNHCYANYPCLLLMYEGVFSLYLFNVLAPKQPKKSGGDIVFEVRSRSVCSDVVPLSCQASLNSSMDSLKAELNTALQCDREAEDEVKKLKVRASKTMISGYICPHCNHSCISCTTIYCMSNLILKIKFYSRQINISATQTW